MQIFLSLIPPSARAPKTPPPTAYLYLAQLSEDDPAGSLELYKTGLDIVIERLKHIESSSNEGTLKLELQKMAIRTIIAMVEIWMSDLWYVYFQVRHRFISSQTTSKLRAAS